MLRISAAPFQRLRALIIGAVVIVSGFAFASGRTEQEVSTGGLHGTLTVPNGAASAPVALFLAGSGPVDRNGNVPNARNDSLKLLADGLADRGIATLRVDKRGVGESRVAGTREEDLRFDTYVKDALTWLNFLRGSGRFGRIVLLGHSEGALVATLAAQRGDVFGLILLAAASEPAGRHIARQLAAGGVSDVLQDASRQIVQQLERGQPVPEVPTELAALYRPSVQSYLISWLPLDPSGELAKVACPVLIVQGTTDIQIEADDARRLAAARPDAKLVIIEGMNHVLKSAPAERLPNLETYNMPLRPLEPSLVPELAAFIHGAAAGLR